MGTLHKKGKGFLQVLKVSADLPFLVAFFLNLPDHYATELCRLGVEILTP